jgi:RNA polymerase sigma-70 factor, ECF subfamily
MSVIELAPVPWLSPRARRRQDTPPMPTITKRRARGAVDPREAELVRRLRDGDEDAFAELVDRYGASMLRVARMYVRDRAAAEEVVQETWLAVLNGIHSFREESSLKTWLFRILANRAKTRGQREARSLPFSSLAAAEAEAGEPSVDPDRFFGPDQPQPGAWAVPPEAWPEDRALARETLGIVQSSIESLPEAQREVIRLRDIEGWSAEEVANALEISDGNQRVLLHRARAKVRAALEAYLNPETVEGSA